MLIRKPSDLRYSDVTPKRDYLNRRRFITGSLAVGAFAGARPARATTKLSGVTKSQYSVDEKVDKITPLQVITSYNNFYEFGTAKGRAGRIRQELPDRPVDGQNRGRRRQTTHPGLQCALQSRAARRADLSASLRGSLVHRGSLDRLFAERVPQAGGAHLQSQVRGV